MKLTIERQGSKIVMIDETTRETAILDSQEQAVSNFASWIYTGHLSGKPTAAKDNIDFSQFVKDWVSIEGDHHTHSTSDRGTLPREAQ
jgi:hypothetical protein